MERIEDGFDLIDKIHSHINNTEYNEVKKTMTYRPTMQDYIGVAVELRRIRNDLVEMHVHVANTFGKKYDLRKAHETIDHVRSQLEDKMFEDFPEEASVDIFYG